MTRAGLMRVALVLLFAALLYACSGERPATPTAVPLPPTPAPTGSDSAKAIPSIVVPGMTSSLPPLISAEATPRTDIVGSSARLGPPSWIKAGTRITYYQASASIAQASFAWIEDPDGPYVDPATGKHYRRTDETGESQGDGAGDAMTVIDVLGVEGSDVVLAWGLYSIDHIGNGYVPGGGGGAKVNGAAIDGLWVNPQQFETMEQNPQPGAMVLTGDYELNGKTYNSVSFVNPTPGNYSSYTYDLDTGLLLSGTTNTTGPAGIGGTQGNAFITIKRFQGVRQRTLPGLTGKNPDWVARTTKLQYTGQYNFTNPVDPSSANYTFPMNNVVTLSKGGKNWTSFSNVIQVQVQGFQAINGSGITGSAGFYWIDPSALKNLRKGQQLDKDPITNETTAVTSVGTQGGRKVVTITTQMPGSSTSAVYDQTSGAAISYTSNVVSNGITVQLQLQNRP